MKKLKKVQMNGNIFHLHKFQGFMLLKYPYCPKPSIDSLFSSVQLLSRVWLFATPWTAACQASLSITISDSCPLSWWCHTTISSSFVPFSSCPQSFRSIFQWVSSSHQVAKVLEFQLQHQSFQWIFRTNFL